MMQKRGNLKIFGEKHYRLQSVFAILYIVRKGNTKPNNEKVTLF